VRAAWIALLLAGCGSRGGGEARRGCAPEAVRQGEATFYDADGSGACSFARGGDLLVAAAAPAEYAGGAACGACAQVQGPDGELTVRIVDSCPGCAPGQLDLSSTAFARIAEPKRGRVPITWRYVPCEVSGPIDYRFKEGSNPFWTALQVRNHRHRIALLLARPDRGDWRILPRRSYNFFVDEAGLGAGPVDLAVIDVHGHMILDFDIPPGAAADRAGAAQLAECTP
jgi:expansin (peptidoglycan-binding protein)